MSQQRHGGTNPRTSQEPAVATTQLGRCLGRSRFGTLGNLYVLRRRAHPLDLMNDCVSAKSCSEAWNGCIEDHVFLERYFRASTCHKAAHSVIRISGGTNLYRDINIFPLTPQWPYLLPGHSGMLTVTFYLRRLNTRLSRVHHI